MRTEQAYASLCREAYIDSVTNIIIIAPLGVTIHSRVRDEAFYLEAYQRL